MDSTHSKKAKMSDIKTVKALWEHEEMLEDAKRGHFSRVMGGSYDYLSQQQAEEVKERLRQEIQQLKNRTHR